MKKQPAVTLRSLSEYVRFVEENCDEERVLFRGQPVDKPLLPKIARLRPKPDVISAERAMLADFRLQAVPYVEFTPESDWDWLALAQHFGMATRLLDWTLNPLAALWFAVEKPSEVGIKQGVVWLFTATDDDYLKSGEDVGPFDIDKTRVFRPRHINRRIIAQSGWFTAHKYLESTKKKYVALENNKRYRPRLEKLIVPVTAFADLRRDLDRCGVNASSMYGGLDGLCSHIQWLHSYLSDESE